MWWDRRNEPDAEVYLWRLKLDRLGMIGAAAGYLGVIIFLILSVIGVVPEFSWEWGRRHELGVISDEATLLLLFAPIIMLLIMRAINAAPSLRRLFQRKD